MVVYLSDQDEVSITIILSSPPPPGGWGILVCAHGRTYWGDSWEYHCSAQSKVWRIGHSWLGGHGHYQVGLTARTPPRECAVTAGSVSHLHGHWHTTSEPLSLYIFFPTLNTLFLIFPILSPCMQVSPSFFPTIPWLFSLSSPSLYRQIWSPRVTVQNCVWEMYMYTYILIVHIHFVFVKVVAISLL